MLTNLFNREGNQTIINVDVASGLHNLGDVLVVEPQNFLITFLHVLVIECELDCVTLLELNLSSAALTPGRESLFILRMKTAAWNLHIIILFKTAFVGLIGVFVIWPELTPLMSPVLISGPLVSRAMATGL